MLKLADEIVPGIILAYDASVLKKRNFLACVHVSDCIVTAIARPTPSEDFGETVDWNRLPPPAD